ncbi:PREDICTED: F-box/LRR-repeat protein 13-like [Ceratosolen solmsi marchali]|uniref:F-box/LRR-repeat protein 13-like n=1 Tax=Ceratosolen solmsi marchali TaxID=326594 RepID=A0AAJ6YLY3_9HYME|nr:PREDICTED: F-box/LRR-repeat protein 13-like [Ceratosolen solmsi marchali]XP_011500467.1 PREDICTED: F-box/LRR-repeat protein 13-like [Ceratosolen solmsi marchali]
MNLQHRNIHEFSNVDNETFSKNSEGIHKLNNDCIRSIFQYLSIVDRIRIERVCKRWQIISRTSWYDIKDLNFDNELWGFKKSSFIEKINYRIFKKVLNRCGQFLISIEFYDYNSRLGPNVLNIVARFCPNLQYLYASDLTVSPWSIKNLANSCCKIRLFSIGNCTDKCDKELSALFKRNADLNQLNVYWNNKITGKCLSKLNSESIETIIFFDCPSILLRHFNVVKNFQNLKVLVMDHFHDSYSFFNNNNTMDNIGSCSEKLRILTLSSCPLYTTSLDKIANLTSLECLDLSCNDSVDDDVLIMIGANCKLLKTVDLSDCNAVTNMGLSHIVSLPLLKSLLIEYLNNISDEVFTRMPNLIHMDCSYCSNVRNTGLATLIELSENIEYLNLSNCKNISNELLEAAVISTKKRKNNTVLKMYLGQTDIDISKVRNTSPYLKLFPMIVVQLVD